MQLLRDYSSTIYKHKQILIFLVQLKINKIKHVSIDKIV